MAWFIDDLDQTLIYITDGVRKYYVPKFRLNMHVEEPYLFMYYNDRERGDGGDRRPLKLNYLDVVDSYSGYIDNPSSAADLMAQIDAMIVSGWTNIGGGTPLLLNKGDILTSDGVSDVIHPAGSDRMLVGYDSSTSDGLKDYTTSQVLADANGVVGPGSSTDDNVPLFDGITGKLLKDSGKAFSIDGTLAANSDAKVPTEKAVKTYVDAAIITPLKSTYVISLVGTVASTNTTGEEILSQYAISGGTLDAGDAVEVYAMGRKNSGAGTLSFKVYLNSANTVGGAGSTLYSWSTGTTTSINEVNILFPTTTSQVAGPATNTPFGSFGNAPATGTLDVANTIYVQVTSQKSVGTDGFDLRGFIIKIHKKR